MSSPVAPIQQVNKSNQLSGCKAYEILTLAIRVLYLFLGFVFLGKDLSSLCPTVSQSQVSDFLCDGPSLQSKEAICSYCEIQ